MRVLVLGAGNIGLAVIHDLVTYEPTINDIFVVDKDERRLKEIKVRFKEYNINPILTDVFKIKNYLDVLNKMDVVCVTLPGKISFNVVREIIKEGVSVVDASYSPRDPFELVSLTEETGTTYVPDSGFCPGISNLFIGHASSNLDRILNVQIIVGGLPQDPKPPLFYSVTWSLDDLIEEYTRPARVIKNGKLIKIDPLSSIEKISIEGLGVFEAIYTDGLRTLLKTVKADNMVELTIRHPGHLSRIKVLRDLGFFGDRTVRIMNQSVKLRKLAVELLRELMKNVDERDFVFLRVIVDGYHKSVIMRYQFDLMDKYDEANKLTAMSRTTGFMCAIVSRLVATGKVKRGVVPLEIMGKEKSLFDKILRELEKRRIEIKYMSPI